MSTRRDLGPPRNAVTYCEGVDSTRFDDDKDDRPQLLRADEVGHLVVHIPDIPRNEPCTHGDVQSIRQQHGKHRAFHSPVAKMLVAAVMTLNAVIHGARAVSKMEPLKGGMCTSS